jgi:dGTPase
VGEVDLKRMSPSAATMVVAAQVQERSKNLARDGYYRTSFTSGLVGEFIASVEVVPSPSKFPQLHAVRLDRFKFLKVEVLKSITYHAIIKSPSMQVVEYRGKEIIRGIFDALKGSGGEALLPDDFKAICKDASTVVKHRAICDFIAGMTDRYAFEFFGRLYGTNHLTIHKPL